MKNLHIENLEEEVPVELRLEIYKEALACIEEQKDILCMSPKRYPLCILLPVLLWDLESINQEAPDGCDWSTLDTDNAFPELKEFLVGLPTYGMKTNPERIEFLENTIKSLTPNS